MGASASAPYDWSEKYGVEPDEEFLASYEKLAAYKAKFRRELSNFDRDVWKYYRLNVQDSKTYDWKKEIAAKLLSQFVQVYPGCTAKIVGSTVNGCGTLDSDLDVCLCVPCQVLEYKTEKNYAEACLRKFKEKCLTNSSTNFSLIESRESARVPMLKLCWKGKLWYYGNPSDKLEINVVVNNISSIRTSHLLRYYAGIDERFPVLCLVIKNWAKSKGIADGFQGTLNGVSLALMVLHFLQVGSNPPIMPNLQKLYPNVFASDRPLKELDFEGSLPEPISNKGAPENTESVGELVIAFFMYYARFRFDGQLISVAQGTKFPSYVGNLKNTSLADSFSCRSSNSYINIEEPYEEGNTARCVAHWLKFQDITDALYNVAKKFIFDENALSLALLDLKLT